MPAQALTTGSQDLSISNIERVLMVGDLSQLKPDERVQYYKLLCDSVGLNPLTRPFEYLELDGKLVLYARRDCTDQLRKIHGISIELTDRQLLDGVYTVAARAKMPSGRADESTGAVALVKEDGEWKQAQSGNKRYFVGNGNLKGLRPDEKANAIMKAETKAKRRVTLSICGLGMLDESELETVPHASKAIAKEEGRAAQQAVAARKLQELEAGTLPESWDWRIALPKLEKQYGPAEVATALKMAGFNSLEETPNREAALTAYEKVRKILAQAPAEQPSWAEKPHEPAPVVKQDPAQKMLERMSDFKSRLAVIQQFKFDLVQKLGKKDGEERYYAVLDKISGHIDTHANEIARDREKATHCASELYFELHPEAVEVSA
jgi:hypothetical protein